MNVVHIDPHVLGPEFPSLLIRGLGREVRQAVEAARFEGGDPGEQAWTRELREGIFSQPAVEVRCLASEEGVTFPADFIRNVRDATGQALWPYYDGPAAAVVQVDFLPSANWGHPCLLLLVIDGRHSAEMRRSWHPIEPEQLPLAHVMDVATAELADARPA